MGVPPSFTGRRGEPTLAYPASVQSEARVDSAEPSATLRTVAESAARLPDKSDA